MMSNNLPSTRGERKERAAMVNHTDIFNKARIEAGKEPTAFTVIFVHEGMRTGCGCLVIRASNKTFTILHDSQTCKYRHDGKQRVGDSIHNAVGSLFEEPLVIPMTDPFCGLFPYEQLEVVAPPHAGRGQHRKERERWHTSS